MQFKKNFVKLLSKVEKNTEHPLNIVDNDGEQVISWGGYSNVFLKGAEDICLSLNLTQYITVSDDGIVSFADYDEHDSNIKQERGQYPLSLIDRIELGI